jgi:hypothetical protein
LRRCSDSHLSVFSEVHSVAKRLRASQPSLVHMQVKSATQR